MSTEYIDTVNGGKTDKVARYKWQIADKPGELARIDKTMLRIPPEYQREAVPLKVREYASNWSWFGCGAIVVALRDGEYWVVDGQHRVLAAMLRSDIKELPCVVFSSAGVVGEAKAFLTINTGRKAVSAISKLKALAVTEDKDARFVLDTIAYFGLRLVSTANGRNEIKCVSTCQQLDRVCRESFVIALEMAAKTAEIDGCPVYEKVLGGLFYMDRNIEGGLGDDKLRARLLSLGHKKLLEQATRASAYFATGGGKVWAGGMLSAVNKGLRNKFAFKGEA